MWLVSGPFHNSAFRRLLAGRVVTNVGDSLYYIGAMWLVFELTGDPVYTGIAGFLTLAPSAFQFLAGPVVDSVSIRRLLAGTQLVQGVVILTIPIAQMFDALSVWLILLVMPVLSALNQLVYPAQTAALPRLLDDEELVAANSAFSIAYQGVEMVANGISGLLIGVIGAVSLFLLDAATFAVAALLFVTITIPDATDAGSPDGGKPAVATDGGTDESVVDEPSGSDDAGAATDDMDDAPDDEESYREKLTVGFEYVRSTVLLWLIVGATVVNFTAGIVMATLPAYADTIGGAGVAFLKPAAAYGVLMASFAAGNFVGAIGASVVEERSLGKMMIAGYAVSGVCWLAAIAVNWLPLTAGLLLLALFPVGALNVQLATVAQSAPPEEYVGRVSSVFGSATTAAIPFGSLTGGVLASTAGPQIAMAVMGVATVGMAGYVFVLPSLRRLPAVENVQLQVG